EGGSRVWAVSGVQTCALPIWGGATRAGAPPALGRGAAGAVAGAAAGQGVPGPGRQPGAGAGRPGGGAVAGPSGRPLTPRPRARPIGGGSGKGSAESQVGARVR